MEPSGISLQHPHLKPAVRPAVNLANSSSTSTPADYRPSAGDARIVDFTTRDLRRERLGAGHDLVERGPNRCHHVGGGEVGLAVDRGTAGGQQQSVPVAPRDPQLFGQVEEELAAGVDRLVSTKLRCRAETPAEMARSSG